MDAREREHEARNDSNNATIRRSWKGREATAPLVFQRRITE